MDDLSLGAVEWAIRHSMTAEQCVRIERLARATACCMDAGECRRRAIHFNPPDLAVMPHKYNANRRHHIARPK